MLDLKTIYKLQADYSIADGTHSDSEVTFEDYMNQCRIFVRENLPEEYSKGSWDTDKKLKTLLNLASQFVDIHKVKVKGYVSAEGITDTKLLLQDVIDSMSGESIIKEALEDPDVDEIQINDMKSIFVVRKGVPQYYTDKLGRVKQFSNNDEIHILLNKLMDDGTGNTPQFTAGLPLLNAKTAKHQYRINAVHHVANTMDKPPFNFPVTTAVIRKFKETKLTIEDLIKGEAVTEKMGRLLTKLGQAELKLFCVGPTGSGKTTLLNIIANTIPTDKRIILVQNPTEVTFQERDASGRNYRNVVHWEVYESGDESTNNTKVSASMENLISNSLRATPDVIIVGEMRAASEFFQGNRAMRTGHKLLSTFHAEDAMDALGRYATELSTVSSATYSECLRLLADTIDIIIAQFKFSDGTRRVVEISEVQGVDANGKPILNTLFKFKFTGKTHKNAEGRTVVEGKFVQTGVLSSNLQDMFFKAGIDRSEIEEFIDPAGIEEVQEDIELSIKERAVVEAYKIEKDLIAEGISEEDIFSRRAIAKMLAHGLSRAEVIDLMLTKGKEA